VKSQRFNSFIFVDFINVYAIIAYKLALKLAMTPKRFEQNLKTYYLHLLNLPVMAEPIPFKMHFKRYNLYEISLIMGVSKKMRRFS
jgi:hypothetical protein